jgi:hypothetical protein
MTQSEAILKHLKSGDTITSLEALQRYGCLRLAAVIHSLRKEGFDVNTEMVDVNGKTIAEYSLLNEPVQEELF